MIRYRSLEDKAVGMLLKMGYTISTAESCTGGLLAGRIINVSGASSVIDAGFVTYANKAKMKYLGVKKKTLDKHGAVSRQCAGQMARGAAENAGADVGLSTTGIAGPGGGTDEKPVGLVYIGCSVCGKVRVRQCRFSGTRQEIREKTVKYALKFLIKCLSAVDRDSCFYSSCRVLKRR